MMTSNELIEILLRYPDVPIKLVEANENVNAGEVRPVEGSDGLSLVIAP